MASAKKLSWIDMLFGNEHFRQEFFQKNQQCVGCEHVESILANWDSYNRHISREFCCNCEKNKKAGTEDGAEGN